MTAIKDVLSKYVRSQKAYKGDFGLEIETECKVPYGPPKFSFWNVHTDGSLRDFGLEYVLKRPVSFGKELREALTEFKEKTKGINFIQDSFTTSVHVHLNFLNDTFLTMGNFFTLYCFVENILVKYSGSDRLSNNFCLPVCDAEENYKNMKAMLQSVDTQRFSALSLDEESHKYAALNLASLGIRGSLEVRSFRGTTDVDLIFKWCSILHALLTYSRQPKLKPLGIVDHYRKAGSAEFLTDIFGELRKEIRCEEEDALIEKNFWYAINVATCVSSWDNLDLVFKPAKRSLRDLDNLSMKSFGKNWTELSLKQQQSLLNKIGASSIEVVEDIEQPAIRTGLEDWTPPPIPEPRATHTTAPGYWVGTGLGQDAAQAPRTVTWGQRMRQATERAEDQLRQFDPETIVRAAQLRHEEVNPEQEIEVVFPDDEDDVAT